MERIDTDLEGAFLIQPKVFGDSRGYFMETWNQERYSQVGLHQGFVQDNMSFSERGVLRGLHFQTQHTQGKLVYVIQGEIFDVAVDLRIGSPTFGEWTGTILSDQNRRQFYIDRGFAHGFLVLSETALVAYKCTDFYHPDSERTLAWNDPDVGIEWPLEKVTLSEKDGRGLLLKDLPRNELPHYLPKSRTTTRPSGIDSTHSV